MTLEWWEQLGLTEEQGKAIERVCTAYAIAGVPIDPYSLGVALMPTTTEMLSKIKAMVQNMEVESDGT